MRTILILGILLFASPLFADDVVIGNGAISPVELSLSERVAAKVALIDKTRADSVQAEAIIVREEVDKDIVKIPYLRWHWEDTMVVGGRGSFVDGRFIVVPIVIEKRHLVFEWR